MLVIKAVLESGVGLILNNINMETTKKWWAMTLVITWHKFDHLHNEATTFLFFEDAEAISKTMLNQLMINLRQTIGDNRSRTIDTLALSRAESYPVSELIKISLDWGYIEIRINSLNADGTLNSKEEKLAQKNLAKLLLEKLI